MIAAIAVFLVLLSVSGCRSGSSDSSKPFHMVTEHPVDSGSSMDDGSGHNSAEGSKDKSDSGASSDEGTEDDDSSESRSPGTDDRSDNNNNNNNTGSSSLAELDRDLGDLDGLLEGMVFIVGNKAPAMDVVTVSEIKSGLFDRDIETGSAELADDISDYAAKDYIVIGSPCDNPIAAELLDNYITKAGKCNFFDEGSAWIRLFRTSPDHYALYVGGGTPSDTRKAGAVIAEFDEYPLIGRTIEVTGTKDLPSLSLVVG